MGATFAVIAASTSSVVLRYAAAFFFVVVAVASAYALFKAGKALERADKVLDDVDTNAMPLLQKAGTTLDGVNANLGNVDQITQDVASITDKLDNVAGAVEGAVSKPARKAAAFSAGVQSAMSSFMRREPDAAAGGDAASGATGAGWTYEAPPASAASQPPAAAAESVADAADTAADAAADPATGG